MEESEDNNLEKTSKEKQLQEDENSISEHITSNSASIENDRSFQEIEIFNQPSGFENVLDSEKSISQEQKPSLDLSSFNSYGLLDNIDKPSKLSSNDGSRNAKSVLEEILANTEFDNTDSKEESFNLFANLDLSDKSLVHNFEIDKEEASLKIKQIEEIMAVKDTTINALSQELDSFREMSNPTYTLSMVSATEYKQLQEECHNKIMECNSIIVYKNDLIQKLTESLDQSVTERKELLNQVDGFKKEIAQLQQQLQETSKMVENLAQTSDKFKQESSNDGEQKAPEVVEKLQKEINDLQNKLSQESANIQEQTFAEIVPELQKEIIDLQDKLRHEKEDYTTEIARLRELLKNIKCGSVELKEFKSELDEKHAKEVEELRMYFEKKCAELEKNYSEEVFSQQSRKLSGSSSDVDLSADFLLSSQPGPDGDRDLKIFKSKEDVEKFKENLSNFINKISKHSLEDVSDKTLVNIEIEVRNELSTLLKIGEKLEIKAVESKYLEEISDLRFQLEEEIKRHSELSVCTAGQEVVSSGDFELTEVVQSYERRLQEQIALAKIDLINGLEVQIQRLVSNESEDDDWPSELLQLRDRFTTKYEKEIQQLKDKHEIELSKLKDEHLKILNGALRRRSLKDDSLTKSDIELLKERDNLKKQVISLRNLLSELVKYFTQAEDELNNTLVDTLLKQTCDVSVNLDQLDDDINQDNSSGGTTTNSSRVFDSLANKTRVHLAPNFSELINMIEHQSHQHDESIDISIDLKNELGMCLEKLKQEANAILALTTLPKGNNTVVNEEISKQLILENQKLKEELMDSNEIISSLEKEKELLEVRVDELLEKIAILESDLEKVKYKMAELIETGHAEVISEGYGEGGQSAGQGLGDTTIALSDLQDKARTMLAQSRTSADPNALQLIEELCRISEKIKEEAKKESHDLLQQIEAADKKYKTTQKFLEDQAVEREQERDEAQKKITNLYEQLKDRDKDRANCQMMSCEAEELQQQIHVLNHIIEEKDHKLKELESERDEAVDKIKILRDVIRELEEQNYSKDQHIEEYLRDIEKLECIINQQNETLDEYKLFKSVGGVSGIQKLKRHCDELEEEVQKLRIGAELAGSEGALRQIKIQINEIEINIDKKTKELELLHSTGTNSCSSPSEDMSVKDLLRSQTTNSTMDECEVPLQQLARLKEKLIRHSRAEEAAIKRINDLDMQVTTLKNEIEEANNEKEFMKNQIQEQIVFISDLQIRLDKEKLKVEHIEKQTNTPLESKIYDLQNEIVDLQEKIRNKDKTINLQEIIIKESQQRLKDLENDIATTKEDELVVEMQREIEILRQENQQMKGKLSTDNQILPNLVENIIQDKNQDIEKLRQKLTEAEKLLNSYTSMNLDKNDLRTLANLKNRGGSIEQLISILDLSQSMDQMRRYDNSRVDFSAGEPLSLKKNDETEFLVSSTDPEISSIEKVGPSNLHYTCVAPLGKPNSTELNQKSTEKRVHFQDSTNIEKLITEIETLKNEIKTKNEIIQEIDLKNQKFNDFEEKINKLQNCLDETEKALTNATKTFEKEQEEAKDKEQKLGVELAEKKMHLSEREKEIETLKEDSQRKDDMYFKLANEKHNLERDLMNFKKDSFDNLDKVIKDKNIVIEDLKNQNQKLLQELERHKTNLKELLNNIEILNEEKQYLQDKYKNKEEENDKLIKEIENKNSVIEHASSEVESCREQISNKELSLQSLQKELTDKETLFKTLNEELTKKDALVLDQKSDIDILNEDIRYYQNEITKLENKLSSLEKPSISREVQEEKLKLYELTKELAHLQELLREKDSIIEKMTEDHDKIHTNLTTIDNKIKETGNIFDLSNRLKNEQKKNADLYLEIHKLKASLWNYEMANCDPVEEITGQVKKELECAAQIDSNILSAVSDQSLSSISEGQDAEVYVKSLTSQKSINKQLLRANDLLEKQKLSLAQHVNKLQQKLNEMQHLLEKEKINNKQNMIEDSKLIEQLRIQLDGTLKYQVELEKTLQEERQLRNALEIQCEDLKKPASSSESTKYKSLPTQNDLEVTHLKKELDTIRQEKDKLIKESKSLKQNNNILENNLKYNKEMLKLETERNRAQEEKFRILTEKERSLMDELLRKKFELEIKDREVEEKKIKMDELEQEKTILKKQKADLIKALKTYTSTPLENSIVPETLENLTKKLEQKSDESKKRLEYIEQIEKEKRVLENRLRAEIQNGINGNTPYTDLADRCNYLFAKNLKLDSVRKALIWQKSYLADYLQSHQKHCLIDILPSQPHENYCLRRRHSPLQHFRAAVYAVISIERMKFLVRRWHNGVRKFEKINARHYRRSKEKYLQENGGNGANFHVGQPVSNQHFSYNPLRVTLNNPFQREIHLTTDDSRPISPAFSVASAIRDTPWSGSTPPSREKEIVRNRNTRIGPHTISSTDYTTLRAPQLVTQLYERVEQIQDKLSIPFSNDSTPYLG